MKITFVDPDAAKSIRLVSGFAGVARRPSAAENTPADRTS